MTTEKINWDKVFDNVPLQTIVGFANGVVTTHEFRRQNPEARRVVELGVEVGRNRTRRACQRRAVQV